MISSLELDKIRQLIKTKTALPFKLVLEKRDRAYHLFVWAKGGGAFFKFLNVGTGPTEREALKDLEHKLSIQ